MREKFPAENCTTAMSLRMDLSLKQLEEAVGIRRQMAALEKRLLQSLELLRQHAQREEVAEKCHLQLALK